ncbi:hypothetical protein CJF42_07385 [Pseudoalteromonas sp. NBT06-2]|uniref:nucleoside-binding protein n=1 Tax=Pseudoalteromonas sp. NBT06-2 TaxID=2025950 RepID=UPI000BA4F56E|nr:nucleoside-binding protein [Pseudoalteromonas sp. NBT06-2]PAJ75025.1 hypothetical protein CJF42_07385 [Pseudoalteromonas sp. NBT06-2]
MSAQVYSALLATALLSTSVSAKQYWSDTSFSLLKGNNYEVGDNEKNVFTLEHASGHSWGNIFTFVDRLSPVNDDNKELYGEVGMTFNLIQQKDSFIKDVYLASQWEFGSDKFAQFDNLLLGGGVNLAVPGANFFNVNLYRRNNEHREASNQLTLAWAFPFADGFVYDGFMDAVDSTDSTSSSYNFTSQLKYDFGQHMGIEKSKLYAGIEYVYWHNKFGIEGVTEKNANLLLQWHF